MSDKDKLLRRYSRWFADVCETGLNPDVAKRELLLQRIRWQRLLKSLGKQPAGWNI